MTWGTNEALSWILTLWIFKDSSKQCSVKPCLTALCFFRKQEQHLSQELSRFVDNDQTEQPGKGDLNDIEINLSSSGTVWC